MPIGTHHSYLEFAAGDDWVIVATLLDAQSSQSIDWMLYDSANVRVIEDGDYTLDFVDPVVSIKVPSAVTSRLARGLYSDALRVFFTDGTVSTMSRGSIYVAPDPWGTTRSPVLITTDGDLYATEHADVASFHGGGLSVMARARSIDPYRKWG